MSTSNHPVEHEELMAYLDGELEPGRAAEAAEHLEQCSQCRQLAADFHEVSEMVAAWQIEEVERELPEEVGTKLDVQRKPVRSVIRFGPFNLPVRRTLAMGGVVAVISLLIIAISVPSLLRSRIAANDSSRAALERSRRVAQIQSQDNQASSRYGPEYGRNQGELAEGPVRGRQALKTPIPGKSNASRPQINNYDSLDALTDGKLRQPAAPSATPGAGTIGRLVTEDGISDEEQETDEPQGNASNVPAIKGPMIIRTAELDVTTDAFDKARASVEEILKRHRGWVGELNIDTPTGSARSLSGTLRVPSDQLEATLSDLKGLGRTEKEAQGGQEVTQQYVDLEARLANSKHTEQRLVEMLRDRTGKLSDVLAVEMQISRVRGEIEQMEAQRKTMKNQVDYATISVTVEEAYKAELKAVPPSTGTQFRNAAIEGYRALVDGIISVLLWLLSAGPTLLVWAAILFFPARYAWKRVRPRFVQK